MIYPCFPPKNGPSSPGPPALAARCLGGAPAPLGPAESAPRALSGAALAPEAGVVLPVVINSNIWGWVKTLYPW